MNTNFVEFEAVRASVPLRQGDVLESIDANANMWTRHLLVITADCDFAHGKNQGRVTCVPLLTDKEYLLEMQVPRLREKLLKRPMNELREVVERVGGPQVSPERMRAWATEEPPESIILALGLTGSDAEKATGALKSVKLIETSSGSFEATTKNLVNAQLSLVGAPSRETAFERVHAPLRQAYSQPPGDALFISAIADSCDAGYFAYLRHIEQVSELSISLGNVKREISHRRISRLKDRYAHALVQRFALVFLSIGLPNEYEEVRDLHADYFAEG